MSQEKKKKSDLKVGDTIKCHDPDDMIDTMNELVKSGVETDFLYKKDGCERYYDQHKKEAVFI